MDQMAGVKTIVFIPGFIASELYEGLPPNVSNRKQWIGFNTFNSSGWELLQTDNPVIPAGGYYFSAKQIMWDLYSDFIGYLRTKAQRVITLAYDFRQDYDRLIHDMAIRIPPPITVDDELVIIGHSYGGLLAAGLIPLLPADVVNYLHQTVSIGTPWYGAWLAPRTLCGRGTTITQMTGLASAATLRNPISVIKSLINVLASWNSIYNLFPNPTIERQLSPAGYPSVWDANTWSSIGDRLRPAMLAAAKAQADIGYRMPGTHYHANIIGLGYGAPGPNSNYDLFSLRFDAVPLDGDGIVFQTSARGESRVNTEVWTVDGEHDRLCSAPGATSALSVILSQ